MPNLNPSSNFFCSSPWSEVRINSDGAINFCHCASRSLIPPNENINKMSIEQYLSESRSIINVKKDMLNGKPINRCQGCYNQEKNKQISFRNRRNLQFGIFPGKDFEQSFNESSLTSLISNATLFPKFYHISLSNLCNYACPMCWPADSSSLTQDLKKANLLDSKTPVLNDWTQGPAWNEFCHHLLNNNQIVCLHIMGGEPFYHKRFSELVNFLVDNRHTNFTFTVVTNGSIFDSKIVDKIKKFKQVQIEISIESFGLSNIYLRYPTKTNEVLENIKKYLELRDQNFDVILRTVPQIFSVYDYDLILNWCCENRVPIDSNIITNPEFFSPALLPKNIKQNISKRLIPFQLENSVLNINLRNYENSISTNASLVINSLNKEVLDQQEQWKKLVDYCSRLDRVRNQNLLDYVPWLEEELVKHGYK